MQQLQRDPASYTDPNGFVYWSNDHVYRRIYADKAPFVRELLAHPRLKSLEESGKLIATRVVDSGEEGLTLGHETIWPRSYPQEWCAPMLQDAAALIVELAAELSEAGYALADGHPWNVLFHKGKPVFIDLGSIVEPHPSLLWTATEQFRRFALNPLHLHAAGLGLMARARLQDLAQGIDAELALRALPFSYKLRHPLVSAKLQAGRLANLATANPKNAASPQAAKPVDPDMLAQIRQGYFAGILREVRSLSFGKASSDWASYYAACPSMGDADQAAKEKQMSALLAELRPATVLDLGSNTGQYAMLAARTGARVVALDQDEDSVAALYRRAGEEKLDVLPLVMDLSNPSPANGWCSEQRPSALERFASDTALMLAVIHHLVFTGNINFEQIAQLARKVSKRNAVIEWVALDDPMAVFLRRTATKDFSFYTRENFIAALEQAGFNVTPMDPISATRQLLHCSVR